MKGKISKTMAGKRIEGVDLYPFFAQKVIMVKARTIFATHNVSLCPGSGTLWIYSIPFDRPDV